MALLVTVTSTKLIIVSDGTQIRFNGADVIDAKPLQKAVVLGVGSPEANEWFVQLRLTGDAREAHGEFYDIRLHEVSNQLTWTNSSKGAEDAAADIAVMIRSAPGGSGGGQVDTIVPGDGIDVDSADPANPIVAARPDNTTIQFNGSGELEAIPGASSIYELTGPVTAGPGTGAQATTITNNAVTNAKLDDMAANTVKANPTAGATDPQDVAIGTNNFFGRLAANLVAFTGTQATTLLDVFTSLLKGLVPASGGGTSNFLRADGTWAVPPDTTGITQLTGDGTAGPGSGSQALTLASIIAAAGPIGSATVVPIITYDAKGRLTAVTSATITPAIGSITGLGTGVATALANNVGSAGAIVVFDGAGGTPSSLVLTNATGLPIAGITGLGTGVAAALAIAVGSAGAFVTFNGAGGTPSSITLTNGTGLPLTGLTGLGTGVATALGNNVNTASGVVTQTGGDARYILQSFVAAKGDIIGASANDTPAITSVGSDGQVLVANSANASGLGYAYRTYTIRLIASSTNLTNIPAAIDWLAGSSPTIRQNLFALAGYTQVRIMVQATTIFGGAGSGVCLRYRSTYSATASDYSQLGTGATEVLSPISATDWNDSGWITITAAALADVYVGLFTINGNGTSDPVISQVIMYLR